MATIEEIGKQASIDGFARTYCCRKTKKYQNVSLADLPMSPQCISLQERCQMGKKTSLGVQVKTAELVLILLEVQVRR